MAKLVCTTVCNLKDLPKTIRSPLYIGRGSFWQNPYVIGKDGDREEVLRKFKRHLWNRKDMMRKLPELRGKCLLCFCAPLPCHGHVLIDALAWFDEQGAQPNAKRADAPHDAHVRAAMLARTRAGRVAGSTRTSVLG